MQKDCKFVLIFQSDQLYSITFTPTSILKYVLDNNKKSVPFQSINIKLNVMLDLLISTKTMPNRPKLPLKDPEM